MPSLPLIFMRSRPSAPPRQHDPTCGSQTTRFSAPRGTRPPARYLITDKPARSGSRASRSLKLPRATATHVRHCPVATQQLSPSPAALARWRWSPPPRPPPPPSRTSPGAGCGRRPSWAAAGCRRRGRRSPCEPRRTPTGPSGSPAAPLRRGSMAGRFWRVASPFHYFVKEKLNPALLLHAMRLTVFVPLLLFLMQPPRRLRL
jgi:hypothetical protein